MKSFLVIGMGRLGSHLAFKLSNLGNDVLIVDKDKTIVDGIASKFADAYVGDARNAEVIKALGVENYDTCFVTIGDDFQSSLEITSLLKENNAKYIVSKATGDMQAKFLKQIGADEVVYPEKDTAYNLARKFNFNNVYDYIHLDNEYAIYEVKIPQNWMGKTLVELDVRNKYNVNVIAIKNEDKIKSTKMAEHIFKDNDHVIIIGNECGVNKITGKKH